VSYCFFIVVLGEASSLLASGVIYGFIDRLL